MEEPKPSNQLAGRVALISGGAQGIGRAIAGVFQREGARVFILDWDVACGTETADELTRQVPNRPVHFLSADLCKPQEIQEAVSSLRKFHSQLHVLVNNAGIGLQKSFTDLTVEDWNRVLDVNLRGAFLLCQSALPLFSESGGSIVNISSVHATHAFPNSAPYACSKAGLVALTRNLALDLASRRIRVNCICPGYIDTRLWDRSLKKSSNPELLAEQIRALHPVGRRGAPCDIAEAALFLASDSSSFITGTDLVVDGGLTVRAHP